MFGFAGAKRKGYPTCCREGEKTCMKGDWERLTLEFSAKTHLDRRLGVRAQLGTAVHIFVRRRDRGQVGQSHLTIFFGHQRTFTWIGSRDPT